MVGADPLDLGGVPRPVGGVLGADLAPDLLQVAAGELAPLRLRLDPVDPGAVQAQDLRLALAGQLRVAEALLELARDLERAEGLDLVLGSAVEDAVGAPQHVVLADVAEQLAEHVGGLRRVAHDRPPGRAELGVDVLVRPHPMSLHRRDQAIDPLFRRRSRVRALRRPGGLEPRVVDDEIDVGEVASGAGHVLGRRVPAPRPEALVGADRLDPELPRLVDERVADLGQAGIRVVEPPGVARIAEGVGKVREHLPGGDRVPARVRLHLVEVRLQRPVVRQRLGVEEHRVPAADELGRVAGLLHDRRRQRTPLGRDRQRRQGDHVGVAAEEELLEEHLAREAGAGIVLSAAHLREHRAEERLPASGGHQVVLEVVPLDVEDELLAAQRRARRVLVLARLGRDAVATARRVAGVAEAALERQQGGGRGRGGEQELAPGHAHPARVLPARQVRPTDRLALDGGQRRGYELPVRAGPELDRKPWILGRARPHLRYAQARREVHRQAPGSQDSWRGPGG